MNLYRITIKLKSSLVTLLKGDTIWGHFVWGIANHEGDETVDKFLEECKTENPPLIVSSAFPQGTICKPIPEVKEHGDLSIEKYSEIKKNKKIKFVNARDYFEDKEGLEFSEKVFENQNSMHNSINRFTNTVEGQNLYSVEEMWAKNGKEFFDLYILSSYTAERVTQLTKWAFENGYGADSSVGKGNIEVESDAEIVQPSVKGKKYVALAPFVLDEKQKVQNLCADTFIRSGKIGGAFSSSLSPYKKTVILFDEGAIFESEEPLQFVGKLLTDIHTDKRICQSGFAPVVPIE